MDSKDHQYDLVEDLSEEEFLELVLEAQREALLQQAQDKANPKTKTLFPKWIFWIIASFLFVNTFAVIFQVFSIPAIEFLKTSAKLSSQEDIALYKQAVVIVLTDDSKGTGFSISSDGTILTNYHVVEGHKTVTVGFSDDRRFKASVVKTVPDVDLAVLEINGEDIPYLNLAKETTFDNGESIYFIGNPLGFTGIANEGKIIDYTQLRDWEVPVVMLEAPVYRGNSGSPVLNKDGQVIGVVFATLDHETHGRVGLFVPIEEYK